MTHLKGPDTREAARQINLYLPKGNTTPIISLQNGVSNCTVISDELHTDNVVAAVVYVAVEKINDFTLKHHGRGELKIGYPSGGSSSDFTQYERTLEEICEIFASAGVPCEAVPDIRREMFMKFLVNCTFNAISAIGNVEYGSLYIVPEIRSLIYGVTNEVLSIAEAEGVLISIEEALAANEAIFTSMKTQKSSTAQDLSRGRKTEIDLLNGYVVECGKKHNIAVRI